jgi:hypothetical protein
MGFESVNGSGQSFSDSLLHPPGSGQLIADPEPVSDDGGNAAGVAGAATAASTGTGATSTSNIDGNSGADSVIKINANIDTNIDTYTNSDINASTNNTYIKTSFAAPELSNANGAPLLDASASNFVFDVRSFFVLLAEMQQLNSDAKVFNLRQRIQTQSEQRQDTQRQSLSARNSANSSSDAAKPKSLAIEILQFIAEVAALFLAAIGFVLAGGITALTAGTASPLMIMSCMGLVAAGSAITSHICVLAGGPSLSLNNLLTMLFKAIFKAVGMSDEESKKWADLAAGVCATVILVVCPVALMMDPSLLGQLPSAITELVGSQEAASTVGIVFTAIAAAILLVGTLMGGQVSQSLTTLAEEIPALILRFGRTAMSVCTGVSGAAQVSNAGVLAGKTFDQFDADKFQTLVQELHVFQAYLQHLMDGEAKELANEIRRMEDSFKAVAKFIADSFESHRLATQRATQSQVV